MPDDHRDQVGQLTAGQLERYANQLARCLKALDTSAPIRVLVQSELATVRTEQDSRAQAGNPDSGRRYDVGSLTTGELERTRRELAASLALARADSPVRVPILAHMSAVDAELDTRAADRPGE